MGLDRRFAYISAAFGLGVAVFSGHGCPSALADSSAVASPLDVTLLDASSAALANELITGIPGVSNDAAVPAASGGDDLLSSLLMFIDGVSPAPSIPGELVGFSGDSSLANDLLVSVLDSVSPLLKDLESAFILSSSGGLIGGDAGPPALLDSLYGLTETETQEDGMAAYELTPADPSGDYVVAIHGGGFISQANIVNWLAYDEMADKTGATIVVPAYPLATEGGTAGTVDPEIANLISSEIAAEGANHVSVYGDSAGGGIALSSVELLVSEGKTVPESMVLDSPALDQTLSNPNIAFVNDPILVPSAVEQGYQLWAGDLPLDSPLVSPIGGSLEGLPPTYVYAGSDEILGPDVLSLEQDAIAQDAPFSFILRSGEIHDWALVPFLDGGQVQSQIYQELGLTGASSAAAPGDSGLLDALANGLQNLSTELSSETFSSGSILGDLSTNLATGLATLSTDVGGLSGDFSAIVADVMAAF